MFDLATEAMVAQLQSKLGKDLDALWQTVMDYRDSECKDMRPEARLQAVKNFFHRNCVNKFMDIVWKHVGFWIDRVQYVEIWECGFATMMYIDKGGSGKYRGTLQIEDMLNGGWASRRYGSWNITKHFTAKQLVELASSYNPATGGIRDEIKEEVKKMVSATIYFDVRTGFCMADWLPKNSEIGNLTARELTAIVLHELGHTLTLVEHAADMYARISTYKYITSAFSSLNGNNTKEAMDLAKETATALTKKGKAEAAKKMVECANKFEKDMAKAGSSQTPESVGTIIGGFIEIAFSLLFDVMVVPFEILGGTTGRFVGKEQKVKVGDIPCNARLLNWQERKADEYAYAHGYGADIVSGLNKLIKTFSRLGYSPKDIDSIQTAEKLHKDLNFFEKMKLVVMAPLMTCDESQFLYPQASLRFKEMLQIMIQQLKSHNADPDWIAKVMKDIESVLENISTYDAKDEFAAKVMKGYDLLMQYISLPGFFDWIVHGRVKKEIERLVIELRNLNNNLVTYYGNKFEQLAKG